MADRESDLQFMRLALQLASRGFSTPNPHVGCVIALGGTVMGEGASEPAGGAHAEVVALRQAGVRARGATAYVTLEPCNHQGRTGPCSLALIKAGVSRVVFAVSDPNPSAGGGEVARGPTVWGACRVGGAASAGGAACDAAGRL